MPTWKAIKWRELVIFLKEAGFEGLYSGGKHQYLVKGVKNRTSNLQTSIDIFRQ